MISFSKNLSLVLFLFVFSTVSSVGTGTTYTFTNAGATGNTGPTQSEINLSYINTNLEDGVTITQQGFQEWNVPTTGTYVIEALGASGGSSSSSNRLGGKGAKIKGTFDLTAGTTLKIVVGQEGLEGTRSGGKDYGGGGGTFVLLPPYNSTESLLVVAGGGGGAAGSLSTSGNLMGNDATQATNGTSGISSNPGAGGTNGSGGTVSSGNAGAGAGFHANGGGNISSASGKSISNGALGGFNQLDSGIGGFGGGGGGWHYGGHGGGGGGFSGGGTGGSGYYGGGGGGSFNSGTSQENHSGFNQGHGKVIITLVSFETFTFTNAGATGREGPTQSQIDSNYSGTNLAGKVTINTRGIQEWTVPSDGNYKIEAYGAAGGPAAQSNSPVWFGKGSYISGRFDFAQGQTLKILVGQTVTGTNSDGGGAGGGGSFVVTSNDTPLIVAGGGGGGSDHRVNSSAILDSTTANRGLSYNPSGRDIYGGAGGGFSSYKESSVNHGQSFLQGGKGGLGSKLEGGFGGGGGHSSTGNKWGAGGGGYSGGSETNGESFFQGHEGGGGSYNSGTDQNNTAGVNLGHGKVIITLLSPSNSNLPTSAPVISQGVGPISKVGSEDTIFSWMANELNATDSDTDASQLSWSILTPPSNGTALIDGNGTSPETFTYQPDTNFHGSDTFSVMISDGENNDSITINLTINPVDDPSVISGDTSKSLNEDSAITGDLNATDIEGLTDGSYFSITTAPNNGSSIIDPAEGNWTYTPAPNFFGNDSFTVLVTDDDGNSTSQIINLVISPVDDPSVISGDTSKSLNEDSAITGDLNATDADGLTDGSFFSISTPPANGSAFISANDGNWTYIPHPNFFGDDSFVISVTDDLNSTNLQTILLDINPIDDPAGFSGDLNATIYLDITTRGKIIAKDIDGLHPKIIFEISTPPLSGYANIDPFDGNWTYIPDDQLFGDDSFVIFVTDQYGNKTFQTISLTAQVTQPSVKTLKPIISDEEFISLAGEIKSTGGQQILNKGFMISSTPDFKNALEMQVSEESNSSESQFSADIILPTEIIYYKAFAHTKLGESYGETVRYNPFSAKDFWLQHATSLEADWMDSEWFGAFIPYTKNWIFHESMGWVFISEFNPANLWLWSDKQEWIWTTNEVFPFFFSHNSGKWLYLLPAKIEGKTFYNYDTKNLE